MTSGTSAGRSGAVGVAGTGGTTGVSYATGGVSYAAAGGTAGAAYGAGGTADVAGPLPRPTIRSRYGMTSTAPKVHSNANSSVSAPLAPNSPCAPATWPPYAPP
ncbi:hypothetical protein PQR15_19485 [Streptomyces lydicus]|nr:hypothetical protein [Streptomyces lydicus]